MTARRNSGALAALALAISALAGCGGSSTSRPEGEHEDGERGGAGAAPGGGTNAGRGGSGAQAGGGAGASSAGTSGEMGGSPSGAGAGGGAQAGAGSAGAAGSRNDAGSAGSGAGSGPSEPDPNCDQGVAPTSQMKRLTNEQYERTIADLLGVTALEVDDGVQPIASWLPSYQAGLPTEAEGQIYDVVAATIAGQVIGDEALLARFLACTPSEADAACWHDTIVTFGRRAFRRPLTDAEIADFELLVSGVDPNGASVQAVAGTLLTAFLSSPSFFLRWELGGELVADKIFRLTSHEMATRLSYMLWGTLPDPELDAAADAGLLTTTEQILTHAERLLSSDRARYPVQLFHESYLGMLRPGPWSVIDKDPERFPGFDEDVAEAMREETRRFVDAVAFAKRGTFQDLFTSTLGFVNARTAAIYGLDPSGYGAELTEVELDPAQRPGVLTRSGFLAAFAHYAEPSPVLRGHFVTTRVLGTELPVPAPVLPGVTPPRDEFSSNREYIEGLTSIAGCGDCHAKYINPPGFVLEAYDAIGAWQTVEASGFPVDTVADVLIDGATVTVTEPADLMQRIAGSVDAQRSYVEQALAHFYERELHALDACTVEQLTAKLRSGSFTIVELVGELTQTDAFRLRALP